jgi:hypothetical protein
MKKIAIIALTLVLALGSLGIGYAHWTDQLFVEGTVKGGQLMVAFDEAYCLESHIDPDTGEKVFTEYLDKDVGKCEVVLEDYKSCDHTDKDGYGKAVVTITDAYPCYTCEITFIVHNIGTIPVIFEEVTISDPTGELHYDPDLDALLDEDDVEIINFDFVNLVGVQKEPCEKSKAEIDVHFKQDAEECKTYEFQVELEAIQYNKSTYWP